MKSINRRLFVLIFLAVFVLCACGKGEGNSTNMTDVPSTKLSIEIVKELSKKGERLSWGDFEQYEDSGDIGSGLYIIRYDMEEPYYVLVGGADMETFPMYIRLVSTENPDNYIDIRTESIDDFVISQTTENTDQANTEETTSTEGVADYPAAIMVNDTIYLLEGVPMPAEVDESAIIGYTESFTDTFPENNGETNFNPELGMPYAQVEDGIVVLYQNEWYLCTPHEMHLSNLYSGDYYSIMLPQGWAIDSEGNEASLIFSEETIATITVEEDFEYGQNIESIVVNWIGMRSSILSEDSIETTNRETVFHKTIVRWEQSAAEEISGESPYPDETHYFYISEDNLFVDIFLRNEEYAEDIENIVKSFNR